MNQFSLSGIDRIALMETFVRIVDAGSLSAAAAQLGTSQPTVSRRLQALERALGLKLLQRTTHVMTLTDDGQRCYTHAKALLDNWQGIEQDLRGATEEPRGVLRVLAPHAFGQEQLITPLLVYLRRFPAMTVQWMLNDRRPDFIAEGIDCAIQVGSVTDPSVVAIQLAEVPRIVVAAPSLLAGRAPPATAAELHALPWLALSTFYLNEVALSRQADGKMHRFAIQPRLITDSLYAIRNGALAGFGAALVYTWIVLEDIRQDHLLHLAPDWQGLPLPVYLVYPQASFYPARLLRFLDIMRLAMAQLHGTRRPGAGRAGTF